MVDALKNSMIFKEVTSLANQKGYRIMYDTLDSEEVSIRGAIGIHKVDEPNRLISISVLKDVSNDEAIWVHELLHAKLYLQGFPKIYMHPKIPQAPAIEESLLEMENTMHHVIIYQEMKKLGYNTISIDEKFVQGVIDDNTREFTTPNKFRRAQKILEGFIRQPNVIKEYEEVIKSSQPIEYSLFRNMLRCHKNVDSPARMRAALVKMLSIFERYIDNALKQRTNIRILNRLNPIFSTKQLNQKASQVLFALKFKEYEDVFLIEKGTNQCCIFLENIQVDVVNRMLDSYRLNELLMLLRV